jgi:uncharacterized protein with GYD domain
MTQCRLIQRDDWLWSLGSLGWSFLHWAVLTSFFMHMEAVMIRLVSRGCFTHNYAKGLVSAPEDREPAVRKLIEGAGGKLLNFYFTTGDTDFMVISEANDAESIIASLLAAVASGSISDVKTARAWTGAEFKAIAEKASKAAGNYRAPGKG